MSILEIYQKYKIMPSLQLHMYRVAGVGQYIAEHSHKKVNIQDIVTVGLLHDMGNIIKFNLDLFPEFFQPEGREYWAQVQDEYVKKYGPDEHQATLEISREVGVSKRVFELLQAVGFSRAQENYQSRDLEKKIVMYADMRVEPNGVVSMDSRLADGRRRWKINHPGERGEKSVEFFEKMASALRKIEEQIFAGSSLNPEDINDKTISPRVESLRQTQV